MRIARHELAAARDDVEMTGAGNLLLNVRDGVRLDVSVERTAQTKRGYSLSGRVAGGDVGYVALVVHDEVVAGSIWTVAAAYDLIPSHAGVHVLREITNHGLQCGVASSPSGLVADTTTQTSTDDGSLVDVLVVWTPPRERQAGGVAQVLAQIDWFIAFTNDALHRSGALTRFRLAGAEAVEYTEEEDVSAGTSLRRLVDPADGYLDTIHALRDTAGADLVSLAVGRNVPFSIADVLGAFSVTGPNASAFAHELGHNMGLLHDRQEPWTRQHPFGHGFTLKAPLCITTIMSYGARCYLRDGGRLGRGIPLFSSPWRYDPQSGKPLGAPRFTSSRGPDGPADGTLRINRNRHIVANLRPQRG